MLQCMCVCVHLRVLHIEWNSPVRVQQLFSDLWSCRTDSRPSCSTSVCRALLLSPVHSLLSLCPHKHPLLDERQGGRENIESYFSMLSVPVLLYITIYIQYVCLKYSI